MIVYTQTVVVVLWIKVSLKDREETIPRNYIRLCFTNNSSQSID